jgi:VIT1/CCC1 family predicted Fe2+/Mn2+ transporter
MSDGLTVPFALAAGLSSAVMGSGLIVTAGLAEIAAGAIAMGLGGYLAAKGDAEHYEREYLREHKEVAEIPEEEKKEVAAIFKEYGLVDEEIAPILRTLSERPHDWVKFMMNFELGIEQPDPARAASSAATISASYIAGGLIPLIPYMVLANSRQALIYSVIATLIALFGFGFTKGKFTGVAAIKSGAETVFIGGLAAAAAFLIARLFSH